MSCRCWNHLDPKLSYTIRAENGWALTLNGDGTATLKHGGGQAAASAATSLTIDPDPGSGTVPPGK